MTSPLKQITLRIRRTADWMDYTILIPEDGYVLDALETAGRHDSTLLFRHACHHASCGSCGLRVNGRERLACITPLAEVTCSGQPLRLEPLRNFPLLGDLLVDFGPFMHRLAQIDLPLIRDVEKHAGCVNEQHPTRFENCIECGLCISACPVAGSDTSYSGAAILAAAARLYEELRQRDLPKVLELVDQEHGLWRCHAAFECSEVCPAGVDPARAILWLRSRLMR